MPRKKLTASASPSALMRPEYAPRYAPPSVTARMYGIGESTVYRLLNEKRIRAVESGRSTLIELRTVDDHMASLPSPEYKPLPEGLHSPGAVPK
jgi:excisionase family DNA binding protein